MKKVIILLLVMDGLVTKLNAQSIAINNDGSTANSSAILDIKSVTKGILVPRMSAAQRNTLNTPANGLLVYDTDSLAFSYYAGTKWLFLKGSIDTSFKWGLSGNFGTNSTNFIGTTDNQDFRIRVNNKPYGKLNETKKNIALGDSAGIQLTSGIKNIAIGNKANAKSIDDSLNIAIGDSALYNSKGNLNIGIGNNALRGSNQLPVTFKKNIALGNENFSDAGNLNNSIAIGDGIGKYLFGNDNIGIGNGVMKKLSGYHGANNNNIAIGLNTINRVDKFIDNIAIGEMALSDTSTGFTPVNSDFYNNIAIGKKAMFNNHNSNISFINKVGNIAIGAYSNSRPAPVNDSTTFADFDFFNLHSDGNIAIGNFAEFNTGVSNKYNTSIGHLALSSYNFGINSSVVNSTAIGYKSNAGLATYKSCAACTTIGAESGTELRGNNHIGIGVLALGHDPNDNTLNSLGIPYQNLIGIGDSTLVYAASMFTGPYYNFGNIAIGHASQKKGRNAFGNTTLGYRTMAENGYSQFNTVIGNLAGSYANDFNVQTEAYNTIVGNEACISTLGRQNTIIGNRAGFMGGGLFNTAVGDSALFKYTSGPIYANYNATLGGSTMVYASAADYNVAIGYRALQKPEFSSNNIAIGAFSFPNPHQTDSNVVIGNVAGNNLNYGDNNILIGTGADIATSYSNGIFLSNAAAIGTHAKVQQNNTMILGGIGSNSVNLGISTDIVNAYGHTNSNRIVEIKNDATGADIQSHIILSNSGSSGKLGGLTWANTLLSGEKRTGFIGNSFETSNQTKLSFFNRDNSGILNERLTLSGTGNVGIGTTSPNAQLQLANSVANRKIVLWETNNNDHQYYGFGINGFTLRYQVNDVSSNHVFYAGAGGSTSNELFRIQGNGNAILAGTLTQLSDVTLKKNIQPLQNSLQKLQQLNGYTYNWKDENNKAQQIGLIAQEVQQQFPQLVVENNDKLSVNYSGMIPVLLEAIKEQQKQIDELKQLLLKNK